MKRYYSEDAEKMVGKKILLRGWVHDVRVLGGISFLLLRDKEGLIQIVAEKKKVKKEIFDLIENLHQEDVIEVRGKVVESKAKNMKVEIVPEKIKVLNKSEVPLPLDPREVTKTNLDTQINWRFLYLRTEEGKAIFKIQNEIINSFREFFLKKGFIEIQPPVIIGSASEGGAELFPIPYFEKQAFLAQSPQLYKQMCALAFEKVFCIVPVFRAEKFNQPTHLNEIRQMDVEVAFANDEDVMKLLEECVTYIIKNVKKKNAEELEVLNQKLKIPKIPFKRVSYTQAIEFLQKKGEKISWGEDFSKTQEKILAKAFGEIFFIKDWPTQIKAFYAMPYKDNPKICRAFDLIYKGIEISSGTQRIHLPDLLIRQIKKKGLNPENFKFYIDTFRYGAPIHSGWSVGLERLTMCIAGRSNIREVCLFPRDRTRLIP